MNLGKLKFRVTPRKKVMLFLYAVSSYFHKWVQKMDTKKPPGENRAAAYNKYIDQ